MIEPFFREAGTGPGVVCLHSNASTSGQWRGLMDRQVRAQGMHNVRQMTLATLPRRLGFFTRLLDQAEPAERYRLATAQIIHAERFGFDSAWIAQHHFHEDEGGLPAPFVFLAQVAAQTSRIRLGTGIVTLPLEMPIRVAEDSAVLDLMCGGRLEIGVGGGGNLSSYAAFGQNSAERTALLVENLKVLRDAWAGRPLPGGKDRIYPANPSLVERVWQATFTIEGARRAGAAGDGLMLSRTQPRPADAPDLPLTSTRTWRRCPRVASLASSPHAPSSSPTTTTKSGVWPRSGSGATARAWPGWAARRATERGSTR